MYSRFAKQQLFKLNKNYSVIKKPYLEPYENILRESKASYPIDDYKKVRIALLKEEYFEDSASIMYPNHNPKPYFIKFNDNSINTFYLALKHKVSNFQTRILEDDGYRTTSNDDFLSQTNDFSYQLSNPPTSK